MNFYELLGVSQSAQPEVIEAAWRTLARKYHPDNQQTGDRETFQQLKTAATVLRDPSKRRAYDIELMTSTAGPRRGRTPASSEGRSAYHPAYVDPYTGQDMTVFDPSEFQRQAEELIGQTAMNLGSSVINQMLGQNPILRTMVKNALKTKRRAG